MYPLLFPCTHFGLPFPLLFLLVNITTLTHSCPSLDYNLSISFPPPFLGGVVETGWPQTRFSLLSPSSPETAGMGHCTPHLPHLLVRPTTKPQLGHSGLGGPTTIITVHTHCPTIEVCRVLLCLHSPTCSSIYNLFSKGSVNSSSLRFAE